MMKREEWTELVFWGDNRGEGNGLRYNTYHIWMNKMHCQMVIMFKKLLI